MNHSWDIARVAALSRRTRYEGHQAFRALHHEHATRVTVTVEGRLGTATARHGSGPFPLEPLIDRAVADAARGPIPVTPEPSPPYSVPCPTGPERTEMTALAWLSTSGAHHQAVTFELERSTGAPVHTTTAEHWRDLSHGPHLLARVPARAPVQHVVRPPYDATRWLLPPYVVSQLLLEPMLNAITGRTRLHRWPRGPVFDPAWGGGTDYEGTTRAPLVFASEGVQHTRATDRRSAGHGRPLSGHAGLADPVVRDLLVTGHRPAAHDLPPGRLVVAGALLACGPAGQDAVVALRPLGPDTGSAWPRPPVLVPLDHLADLLDSGEWCGPWQRGLGPWTSRWLTMGAPDR